MSNIDKVSISSESADNREHNKLTHPTQQKLNGYTFFIACTAAIAGILFGFDTGIISGAILFISTEFNLTSQAIGVVVGAMLLGAFFGSVCGGRLTDYIGRRHTLIVTAFIFIVGTVSSALSPTINTLILSRAVIGVAIGIACFTAPLYLSEIAPARFRGMLVSLNQLAITIGILLAYIVSYAFVFSGLWRYMFMAGVIPAVLLLIGMLILPESPRWLMLKGKRGHAQTVLKKIRGTDNIQKELNEIQKSLDVEKGNWRLLFKPMLFPIVFITFGLAIAQQITGINTIFYYAPTTFLLAGFDGESAAILATMGVGVVNVLSTIIALMFVDSWGRRPLLLLGLTGMAIAMASMGFIFLQADNSSITHWLTLGATMLYIICFAFSLGPIMWLVISELFPLRIRGLGMSIAIGISWAVNMVVASTFLNLFEALTPGGIFLLYAVTTIFSLAFVYFFVPETKGVSLEQIEVNLHERRPMRELGAQPNEKA